MSFVSLNPAWCRQTISWGIFEGTNVLAWHFILFLCTKTIFLQFGKYFISSVFTFSSFCGFFFFFFEAKSREQSRAEPPCGMWKGRRRESLLLVPLLLCFHWDLFSNLVLSPLLFCSLQTDSSAQWSLLPWRVQPPQRAHEGWCKWRRCPPTPSSPSLQDTRHWIGFTYKFRAFPIHSVMV